MENAQLRSSRVGLRFPYRKWKTSQPAYIARGLGTDYWRSTSCALLVLATLVASSFARPPVTALTFSPEGETVLAGSQGIVEIRAWPGLKVVGRIESNLSQIHDLCFSPNGQRLLVVGGSPSEFGQSDVLSWPDRKTVASSTEHDDVVYSAVWTNEDQFTTASVDNSLIQWRVRDEELSQHGRLTGHSRRALAVDYLSANQLLVSGGVDRSLRVWSASGLERVLDHHTDVVRDIAVRPGKQAIPYVASASADKTVRIWQPTIGRLVRFARLPVEPLSIAWSLDGRWLGVGCTDGSLRVVDPLTVQVVSTAAVLEGWAYEVAAAKDGSFVVGGSSGRVVRITPSIPND